MANTYTWTISALETSTVNGLENVVKTVHWRLGATDGTNSTDVYGSAAVGEPTPEQFVDFASLTEEIVVSWLEATLDVPALKESLDAQLVAIANPTVVTQPAPWTVVAE